MTRIFTWLNTEVNNTFNKKFCHFRLDKVDLQFIAISGLFLKGMWNGGHFVCVYVYMKYNYKLRLFLLLYGRCSHNKYV